MEYIEGVELYDFIVKARKRNDMIPEQALHYIFSKLLCTLALLHREGIAHRDIKLENIRLTTDCNIVLIDFGLSAPMIGQAGTGYLSTFIGTK